MSSSALEAELPTSAASSVTADATIADAGAAGARPHGDGHEDNEEGIDGTITLSKNQQKKLRKKEQWEKSKLERRQREKEARKAKHAAVVAAAEAAGISRENPPPGKRATLDLTAEQRATLKRMNRDDFLAKCRSRCSIAIDCDWQHIHSERIVGSLVKQLTFCYAANRRAAAPSLLYYTGVNGALKEALGKSHAENWTAVECYEEGYLEHADELLQPAEPYVQSQEDEYLKQIMGVPPREGEERAMSSSSSSSAPVPVPVPACAPAPAPAPRRRFVYLTSESENVLSTLEANCVYIVGGIIDRNSHKGVTLEKATAQGVETAKLPILEHVKLQSSTVLTINQVVDILLKYGELGGWKAALEAVIPLRKRVAEGEGEGEEAGDAGDEGDGGDVSGDEQQEEGEGASTAAGGGGGAAKKRRKGGQRPSNHTAVAAAGADDAAEEVSS